MRETDQAHHEELSYFNLQLASMLRQGIPLEGALRQLVRTMHRGSLRKELEALEQSLAAGSPLKEALAERRLPDFYKQMLQLGARTHDFPGILTLLADYYQNLGNLWTRLRGLMVYPALLLVCSLGLSVWFVVLHQSMNSALVTSLNVSSDPWYRYGRRTRVDTDALGYQLRVKTLLPPVLMTGALLAGGGLLGIRRFRDSLQWRLPAFREANLSRLGATIMVVLRGGGRLEEALQLIAGLEGGSCLGREMRHWQQRLAQGHGKFEDLTAGSRVVPPLFIWLVASAGEDLATGFQRAADVYRRRAVFRIEALLYAALPVSILVLGLMIFAQVYPYVTSNLNQFYGIFGL
jgi:type II secretory pathway component PulF